MGHAWLVKLGTRVTPWMIRSGLPVKGSSGTPSSRSSWWGDAGGDAAVARKLGGYHVQVILDYGVEGGDEEKKDSTMPAGVHTGDRLCGDAAQYSFYEREDNRHCTIWAAGETGSFGGR